jgi:hypothetical protein
MWMMDFGISLDTSKVPDARRQGARSEAYLTYAAGPSTLLRVVSLSNETSERWQRSRWHFDGGSGEAVLGSRYYFVLHTAR